MADFTFNALKGKTFYYASQDGVASATHIAVLLKTSGLEADDTLNNATSLSGLVSGATDEATDGSYSRKTISGIAGTIDNTNNWVTLDSSDITWTALAGGAISKLVINFKPSAAADSAILPVTCHDFAVTPDGTDVTATVANYCKIT